MPEYIRSKTAGGLYFFTPVARAVALDQIKEIVWHVASARAFRSLARCFSCVLVLTVQCTGRCRASVIFKICGFTKLVAV